MIKSAPLDIVIAGGGTAGWIAAATFARFLGNRATITLIESDEIGTVGVGEATIPQIHNLIVGLGIDQAEFLRDTNGSFKLGIEFSDWRRKGHSYIHSFGTVGRGVGLIAFRQLWLRARAMGVANDFGDYSINIAAARLSRMAKGDGSAKAIADLSYAYHFDATAFAAMLRRYSEARGVTRIEGRIGEVERDAESGDITALHLDRDRRVSGACSSTAPVSGRCCWVRRSACRSSTGAIGCRAIGPSSCRVNPPRRSVLTPSRWHAARGGSGAFRSSIAPAMAMSFARRLRPKMRRAKRFWGLSTARRLPTRACSASLADIAPNFGRTTV